MKRISKYFIALFILLNSSNALSDLNSDANKFLNQLEVLFPELLTPTNTQYISDFCLRHYPEEEIYTGVVCGSGNGLPLGNGYALVGPELFEFGSIEQYREIFENQSNDDGNGSDGNGSCVNIPFTAHEGVIERLRTSMVTNQGSQTFNHSNEYLSVTDTSSTTKVTISDISGLGDSSETILTEHYQIQDNFLYPNRNVSTQTTTLFGQTTTTKSTTTISPPFKSAPVNTLCEGQTWTANAHTETTSGTITVMGFETPTGTDTTSQPGYSGIVTSISQSVTVPAGTFNTVQLDETMTDGFRVTSWISNDIGALVKVVLTGVVEGQTFTSTTELLSLEQ